MSATPPPVSDAIRTALEALNERFRTEHPLYRSVPMTPVSLSKGRLVADITLPEDFDDEGMIHGGLFTILLDTFLATAAWSMMDVFQPVATINLKTDFFHSVPPSERVRLDAECSTISDDVAFCRGNVARIGGMQVAQAEGTFMVGLSSTTQKGSRL